MIKQKQITMAELISEEKASMMNLSEVNPKSIMKIPQMRIVLKESGICYETPEIRNRKALSDFAVKLNEFEAFEKFTTLAVNARNKVISIYSIHGSLSEVPAYPRVIATFALLSGACSLFFIHNHPGGTCAPSCEDISSTIQLNKLLRALGINVLDHLIVADGNNIYSMAEHRDVDFTR